MVVRTNTILLPQPMRSQVACGDTQGLSACTFLLPQPVRSPVAFGDTFWLSAHLLSFFRGYQSSFYHPETNQSSDILDDGSRLFLIFFWDFPANTFCHPGTIKWMTHKEPILPSKDNQVDDAQRTHSTVQKRSSPIAWGAPWSLLEFSLNEISVLSLLPFYLQ